jgi:hypothetical protein
MIIYISGATQLMKTYYVSWHTWHMGEVITPWDFWFLSTGTQMKPKNAHTEEQNQAHSDIHAQLQHAQEDFIKDVKLMAFVPAESDSGVKDEIAHLFPDAQFDKVQEVDAHTQSEILKLIDQTLKNKKV